MSTESESLLQNLRSQPFYKGQILRVRDFSGLQPRVFALPDVLERASALRGGVLSRILPVLGMFELYASTVAALARAYSQEEDGARRDTVLISPYSAGRELFWQLVCLADALDFSRMTVILCPNDRQMDNIHSILNSTLKRADIQYTLTVARISGAADFSAFDGDMPMVVLMTPEALDALLNAPAARSLRKQILSALGRVAIPCLDVWPPALASHVAFLLRRLHMECALHGAFPSLVGTMLPTPNAMEFIRDFWGKPIPPPCLIRADAVEGPPLCVVNYGGALLQNPVNKKQWIREPITDAAVSLLKWLVHADERHPYHGAELHYVLDASGSMGECIKRVSGEVAKDLEVKLQNGELRNGDQVVLSSFNTQIDCRFRETFDGVNAEDIKTGFGAALKALESDGGTDIPGALGTALVTALAGAAQAISVILFSDGQSLVSEEQRSSLVDLTRRARADGRLLGVLFVVLDLDPLPEICNLIEEMGGTIGAETGEARDRNESVYSLRPIRNAVVILSGEKGLSEDVMQSCPEGAGARTLVFARSVSDLFDPSNNLQFVPRDVSAVVVSGRYGGLAQILDQVKHLGREFLPVFVLAEPEAWSQALCEDSCAGSDLCPSPLIWSQNRHVLKTEIERALPPGGTMDADIFAYLLKGSDGYMAMLNRLGLKVGGEFDHADALFTAAELPQGFSFVRQKGFLAVRHGAKADQDAAISGLAGEAPIRLRSWTQDVVTLRGDAVNPVPVDLMMEGHPLLFHQGAIMDQERTSLEVDIKANGDKRLTPRSPDRCVPLLENVSITPLETGTTLQVSDLGLLSLLPIRVEMSSPGFRRYDRGNLDDRKTDVRTGSTARKSIETYALRWTPSSGAPRETVAEGVRVGLANIIRLMAVSLLPWADRTVFVHPDADSSIWVIDLAPGGNGVAQYLYTHRDVLQNALRVGGQILLECPCEGGFAGASTVDPPLVSDTGCPRCARVIGPVILDPSGEDRCARVSKRGTIEWLVNHNHLTADMARLHMREKFEGIDDAGRYKGPADDGTRRAIIPLVHRILKDRLGLDLPGHQWATLRWLPNGDENLGSYSPRDNVLSVQTMLREWMAYSVCAHEVFHNMQAKLPGVFADSLVADDKIDLEGSAVWAESHILDALAIRTALDLNNLRSGDEYAEGFQRMKAIENDGGVRAVLHYLKTGTLPDEIG